MCSSSVFAVNGRVGFVEDGNTLGSLQTVITNATYESPGKLRNDINILYLLSGACPPPAPSL